MSDDFAKVLLLRTAIQAATHEIKRILKALHEKSGVPEPDECAASMGISRLVLHVNELEAIAKLTEASE